MSQRNVFYYDQASNISCVCDPDSGLTYYEYDLLNRTTSVKNPFGEVTYYEYTPGGQVKIKVYGNGAISYYSQNFRRCQNVWKVEMRTTLCNFHPRMELALWDGRGLLISCNGS